jgi:hypothetical protein
MSSKCSASALRAPVLACCGGALSPIGETRACAGVSSPITGCQETEHYANATRLDAQRAGEPSFVAHLRALLEGTIGR